MQYILLGLAKGFYAILCNFYLDLKSIEVCEGPWINKSVEDTSKWWRTVKETWLYHTIYTHDSLQLTAKNPETWCLRD